MSKHTIRLMEYMLEHPNPGMEFAINSNGCPPDKLWKQFTVLSNKLVENNCVKRVTLFLSAESVEQQAEYSRDGMDWSMLKENVTYFLENTKDTRVVFMSAFNLFSLPTFINFLEYVLSIKKKYTTHGMYEWLASKDINLDNTHRGQNRIGVDIPYVRHPEFLDVALLTIELVEEFLLPAVNFMYANSVDSWNGLAGFHDHESLKLKRILTDVLSKIADNKTNVHSNEKNKFGRSSFYQFVNEYDQRRDKDFITTFPEMKNFYAVCKTAYEELNPPAQV
jgi:hypothetical protein